MKNSIRHDWTFDEIKTLYHQPLLELIYQAAVKHREFHDPEKIQMCYLISVKTGGCIEDCKYCAQSSRYQTPVTAEPMLSLEEVLKRAKIAIQEGATRICLGVAWREVRKNKLFEKILKM